MIYCDALLIVALLTEEAHSAAALGWAEKQPEHTLAVSPWVEAEVASALALKHRLGLLDEATWRTLARGAALVLADFTSVPVEARHFRAASERFVSAPPTGLRAGDALHLAIVADHAFDLVTLDVKLRHVAEHAGVRVHSVMP